MGGAFSQGKARGGCSGVLPEPHQNANETHAGQSIAHSEQDREQNRLRSTPRKETQGPRRRWWRSPDDRKRRCFPDRSHRGIRTAPRPAPRCRRPTRAGRGIRTAPRPGPGSRRPRGAGRGVHRAPRPGPSWRPGQTGCCSKTRPRILNHDQRNGFRCHDFGSKTTPGQPGRPTLSTRFGPLSPSHVLVKASAGRTRRRGGKSFSRPDMEHHTDR
jgi:hypothetical protein